MTKEAAPSKPSASGASLDAVMKNAQSAVNAGDVGGAPRKKSLPPVHLWNPPFCGDLDMVIARDGSWKYLGTPIGRPALVKLFASVLRRDADGKYYLVTPVEKVGIKVEDAPFIAVDLRRESDGSGGETLIFTTNLGDETVLGPDAPLRVVTDAETGEPRPYVLVRGQLEALIDRKTFYRLAEIGTMAPADPSGGGPRFGVWSSGRFFALAEGSDLSAESMGDSPEGAQPGPDAR